MYGMRSPVHRRIAAVIGVAAIASLTLAGCAEGGSDDGGDSGSVEGETVSISGGITGIEAENMQKSFDQFTEDTGIIVEYTGDKAFEGNIVTKVQGGDAPDIAIVPQPGLLKTLVGTGEVKEAPEGVVANVDENWSPDWKAYGTVDDVFYAAPMLANIKGYVWYSPASFAEWGVEIPKTYDELLDLTKTIQEKTGSAPWCAGFESEAASGWPGTDWIEDLVLRQSGPEVYDQWVADEVKFTDPQIADAFDAVGEILLNPDYVNASFGDVASINSTAFANVAAPVANGTCALTHQASFLSANFLDTTNAAGEVPTVAPDGDVYAFVLPGFEEGAATIEVGGEFVTAFSDDAATVAVLEYMSTPEWADARVSLGGNISANLNADPSLASSEFLTEAMTLLQDPNTTVRFDASDLMPSTVGAGSFWKGMVDWIDGKDQATVLSDIQAGSHPAPPGGTGRAAGGRGGRAGPESPLAPRLPAHFRPLLQSEDVLEGVSMSDTTKTRVEAGAAPPLDEHSAEARAAAYAKKRRTTALVLVVAAILVVALFLFMVTRAPVDDARPVSLGFSLNSFFRWIGGLGPLVQIPIVLIAFGAVVGLILLLIEYAPRSGRGYFWLRLIACFAIPVLAFMLLRPYQNAVIYVLLIAVILGGALFYADYRSRQGAGFLFQLVIFAAPASILLLIGLIYPAIATIVQSFFDKTGKEFVGLENYIWTFTNPEGFWSVINTVIWVLVVPAVATIIGLAYAVFIDRARGEKFLKVLIFMTFAISFVGAGIIWKLTYDYRQGEQIGILNAIVVAFGGEPVSWLAVQPLINTFFLMVVFIWSQTGLAMVILSAAVKAVPIEQMEAASLDGTNAWQRFRNVTLPGIRAAVVVVVTTIAIGALKIYDVVAVMTGGRSDTTVLAFEMVNQQQRFQSYGHSAALAVVLFIFVIPLIVFNVVQIRKQREIR